MKLKNNFTGYSLLVACCYLPPENSPWGRDSVRFFAHLLTILYMYSECDSFLCLGDLNALIGDSLDYITDVDSDIPAHSILDKQTNQHGRAFVEFLTDVKMSVLNGRCDNNADDFTSISARGRSVVDYIAVAHSDLMYCSQFSVSGMSDLLMSLNLNRMLHSKCKASDHSFVMFKLTLSHGAKMLSRQENVKLGHVDSECGKVTRRYKLKCINDNIFKSETSKLVYETQDEVDVMYDNLVKKYCE